MKRSEFPEKAYEAMFIRELLDNFSKPGKTPFYIPSQVKEKEYGYDLCFVDNSGSPINRKVLLIQFKTSFQYEGARDSGFYKFEIYKGKNPFHQHNKLCSYNAHGNKIAGIYCAPWFVTYKEFYKKVMNTEVIADSVFFRPTLPLYTGHHFVKFNNRVAIQCSKEQREYKVLDFKDVINSLEPLDLKSFDKINLSVREKLSMKFDGPEDDDNSLETNNPSSYFLFL